MMYKSNPKFSDKFKSHVLINLLESDISLS